MEIAGFDRPEQRRQLVILFQKQLRHLLPWCNLLRILNDIDRHLVGLHRPVAIINLDEASGRQQVQRKHKLRLGAAILGLPKFVEQVFVIGLLLLNGFQQFSDEQRLFGTGINDDFNAHDFDQV